VATKSKVPEIEVRTRIVCHFPMNRKPSQQSPNQLRVMRGFIRYLQTTNITGFTMSSLMDTVCTGFWRSDLTAGFQEENVVVFVIDLPLQKNDPELWAFAHGIKQQIQSLYQRYADQKEQDVWIVVHAIDRLA
jgi:hypothetical protein